MVSQKYDEALRPAGIKMTQFTTLVTLAAMKSASLTELAQAMGVDRTTLSRNMIILSDFGLVLVSSSDDQRERQLMLTPAGHKRVSEALPLWRAAQQSVIDTLGKKRIGTLLKQLQELNETKV